MSEWVKLPKGAQVTMSRDQVRAMQGLTIRGKVVLIICALALLWLVGHTTNDNTTNPKPNPTPSVSAPAKTGE